MKKEKKTAKKRQRRRFRVRNRIHGTKERPRLSVYRSNTHFACQAIDDDMGNTLFAISTYTKAFREMRGNGANVEAAAKLGTLAASGLKELGITCVSFDRGHYKFHGRVKAFAEKLREGEIRI